MTSCCHRPRMQWSGATGAIARGKNRSTGYARRTRSVPAWRWICGVKPTPKAVNKPLHHFIVHELDKPGSSATVSQAMSSEGVKRWSIDCKATVKIGEFSRGGVPRGDNRASDHDMGCKEKYIPCGIVDEDSAALHITFGSS